VLEPIKEKSSKEPIEKAPISGDQTQNQQSLPESADSQIEQPIAIVKILHH
jgi:hypothetical protein